MWWILRSRTFDVDDPDVHDMDEMLDGLASDSPSTGTWWSHSAFSGALTKV